jgi:S1-C subfamily serine protease
MLIVGVCFALAAGKVDAIGSEAPASLPPRAASESVATSLEAPSVRAVYFVFSTKADDKGQVLASTRGVAFSYHRDGRDCVLITARHVIQDASEISVYLWNEDLTSGVGYEARVKWVNESKDLAALVISNAKNCDPVRRNESSIPLGRRIFAFLNLPLMRGMITSGAVGAYWNTEMGPMIVCDMKVYPGQSGSPVFDAEGVLIGMISSRTQVLEMTGAFVLPANRIEAEVQAQRVLLGSRSMD